MASSSDPPSTNIIGRSRSVRICAAPLDFALKSFTLSRKEDTMVGSVRARVIRPEASTAPAPV